MVIVTFCGTLFLVVSRELQKRYTIDGIISSLSLTICCLCNFIESLLLLGYWIPLSFSGTSPAGYSGQRAAP
jgi:hypothetical protein